MNYENIFVYNEEFGVYEPKGKITDISSALYFANEAEMNEFFAD